MRGNRQPQRTSRCPDTMRRRVRRSVVGLSIVVIFAVNPAAAMAQSGTPAAPQGPVSAAPGAAAEVGVHNANVNWIVAALCLLAAVVLLSTIWFWKATKPVPPALGRLSRIDVDELRQLRQRAAGPRMDRSSQASVNATAAQSNVARPSTQRSTRVHSTQRPVTSSGRLPPKRSPSGSSSSPQR
jgi:hypothetical protein